jgi:hypothetical protein
MVDTLLSDYGKKTFATSDEIQHVSNAFYVSHHTPVVLSLYRGEDDDCDHEPDQDACGDPEGDGIYAKHFDSGTDCGCSCFIGMADNVFELRGYGAIVSILNRHAYYWGINAGIHADGLVNVAAELARHVVAHKVLEKGREHLL